MTDYTQFYETYHPADNTIKCKKCQIRFKMPDINGHIQTEHIQNSRFTYHHTIQPCNN